MPPYNFGGVVMTVQEYDVQISNLKSLVDQCNQKINNCKNEIDDLNDFIGQLDKILNKINESVNVGKNMINTIESAFERRRSAFGFFDEVRNVFSGSEYKKSCAGISESKKKANARISDLNRDIRTQRQKINSYESRINELTFEKNQLMGTMGGR